MNDSSDANTPVEITATKVPGNLRSAFLPKHFGKRVYGRAESLIFSWMKRISAQYTGGSWHYYELSNGSFYVAPEKPATLHLTIGNGFDEDLSADAAGLVTTSYVLSQLMAEFEHDDALDALVEKYHGLIEFMRRHHPESEAVMRAIE
jgi:hypothetical protein